MLLLVIMACTMMQLQFLSQIDYFFVWKMTSERNSMSKNENSQHKDQLLNIVSKQRWKEPLKNAKP